MNSITLLLLSTLWMGDPAAPPSGNSKEPAWRPDKASEVLTLVQAFYDSTQDMRAGFSQTYWNPAFASRTVTGGILKIKRPGMMSWDYHGKSDPDYFIKGDALWSVEHDTKQVIRTELETNSELRAATKFLFGGQSLVRDFKVRYAKADKVTRYGDLDHHVLELKPRVANPHFKGLVLIVHATTGRVDGFVVYNQDGSSNHFALSDVATNAGLAASQFQFKLPKGYVETVE